jgi:hypothetical protein
MWRRVVDGLGDEIERLFPREAGEAAICIAPDHGAGNPAEQTKSFLIEFLEPTDVPHDRRVQRAHRVQLEELQPGHAQMNAVEYVVSQAVGAERTAVADAVL